MYTLVIDDEVKTENMMLADSFFKRFMGLMFKKDLLFDCLMINPCNSIHTFNMRFNIDVLYLDESMTVIAKEMDLKPGRVVGRVGGAKRVLEAKAGFFDDVAIGMSVDYTRTI